MKEVKAHQLKLNEDYYVVSDNDLIHGRQKMTEREMKLLLIAISQVVKKDKDLKTYTTTIPELAEFLEISSKSLHKDLESICTKLLQRVVKIKSPDKNSWEVFQWVNYAKYENGLLTIRLSDDIKPYLIDLSKKYTQYQIKQVLKLKSYYSTRLYQLLKCETGEKWGDKDEWVFSCERLREFFQTEKLYARPTDLINKTIKTAIKELNETPFVHIWNYTEIKGRGRGKPLIGVKFNALLFDSQRQKDSWISCQPIIAEILK